MKHRASFVFGAFAILVVLFGYWRGAATTDWPSTTAVVESVEVNKKYWFQFWNTRSRPGNSIRRPRHVATIRYAYSVNGESYASSGYDRHFLGWGGILEGGRYYLEGVLRVHEKYAPGSDVVVYYDPDDPGDALLFKGYRGSVPVYLLFGGLLMGSGLYGMRRD